jgi:hypothetical protein
MSIFAAMSRGLRTSTAFTVLATVFLSAGDAAAQPRDEGGMGGPRRGPPPEALAACKALAAGKACSVTLDSKMLKGTCWAPEGKPLACRPDGAPVPGAGKPASSSN